MALSAEDFKQTVSTVLRDRQREQLQSPTLAPAAVLVPLFQKDGRTCLLFTKRTDTVAYHKGQISFPGGMRDPSDSSLLQTALRETKEEVGLDVGPEHILGMLDDTPTISSNFVITPYVAFLDRPLLFDISRAEVRKVLQVPLDFLLAARPDEVMHNHDGKPLPVYYYQYGDDVIWGATGRMVKHFLDLVRPALSRASTAST